MRHIAVVCGSTGALGNALATQISGALGGKNNVSVIGLCRTPRKIDQHQQDNCIQALETELAVDLNNEESVKKAASVIKDKYGKVDLLINASGILKSNHVNSVEFSMENVNAENVTEVFRVNSLGTLLLLKSFKSLLKSCQTACIGSPDSDHRAVFLNVAAQMGTFNYNSKQPKFIPWYSYIASKTAQNMFTLMAAKELAAQKTLCVGIDPGIVKSKITDPFAKFLPARAEPNDRAAKIISAAKNLKMSDSGLLLSSTGVKLDF